MKLIVVMVAAVLFIAGCGGGDGSGSASIPQPQTSPPPSGTVNATPTLQGQPGTAVLAGQSYSFQPTANDADGDTLTFSATNLPSWATLNPATGRLSGTPAAADVGNYSGIVITVSDGKASASLATFNIAVTAVANGSATVSWTPPTQNTDGSALTNLSGYQILYGRSAENLTQSISVTNPSISTYVVENLTAGAWYFAVVAVNADGATSGHSNVATKTIS